MQTPDNFFDAPDADIILRPTPPLVSDSLDGRQIEFRVHKLILAMSSVVFRDMLSLPQPATEGNLPVVDLPETAATIETLLRFIYPIEDPEISSLSALTDVLALAIKYEASFVTIRLRKLLISEEFLKADPFHVYAIAARYELNEEVGIAAIRTLSVDILYSPQLADYKYVTAYDYHRLLTFHGRCRVKAIALVDSEPSVGTCECKLLWLYSSYRQKAKEELAFRPVTTLISSSAFVMSFLGTGGGCSQLHCMQKPEPFRKFVESMARKIDSMPTAMVHF